MEARLAVEKTLADKEAEHTESNKRLEDERAAVARSVTDFTHSIFGKSSFDLFHLCSLHKVDVNNPQFDCRC